ncbi:MAG: phage tail protein [Saprospiraceae bacterium]|nr:phage tail protein [Saprospiraceae bacterium]
MAEPFLSEIRMMSFSFPPKGWALCNGQLLPINQNQGLFSLLGTTYGGDGQLNFALPDLRGRAPVHVDSSHTLGERGGEQSHTLSISELPQHDHDIHGTNEDALSGTPAGNLPATTPTNIGDVYAAVGTAANGVLNNATILNTGGSQAHLNMQPFLTISFCIALQGIFPSPN